MHTHYSRQMLVVAATVLLVGAVIWIGVNRFKSHPVPLRITVLALSSSEVVGEWNFRGSDRCLGPGAPSKSQEYQ